MLVQCLNILNHLTSLLVGTEINVARWGYSTGGPLMSVDVQPFLLFHSTEVACADAMLSTLFQ